MPCVTISTLPLRLPGYFFNRRDYPLRHLLIAFRLAGSIGRVVHLHNIHNTDFHATNCRHQLVCRGTATLMGRGCLHIFIRIAFKSAKGHLS